MFTTINVTTEHLYLLHPTEFDVAKG